MRGGMAMVNIVASYFFGGISGSASADTASLGTILIPMMTDQGYDTDFSTAVTITSSCEGLLVPPSHNMVIYATAAGGVSIGRLFMAGYIPGAILAVALMIGSYIISKKRHYPVRKFNGRELLIATKEAFLSLMTPVIIIGGIWSGVFSPTEAACIAVVYAFILSVILYKGMTLREIYEALKQSVADGAGILNIICGAAAFSWLVTMMGMTNALSHMLTSLTTNKYIMLLILNIAFLIIGMFMEALAVMTITVPFLIPLMGSFGIDPVHLGVVLVLNLMIGLCTPPVGTSLFICAKTAKIRIEEMYKAVLPFLVPLLVVLFLITYVPGFVTWLPGLSG
jgi:tripartite ATP-independent transporter DctM subunit